MIPSSRQVVVWLFVLIVLLCPACGEKRSNDALDELVKSILEGGRRADVSTLFNLTVGSEFEDINEVTRNFEELGLRRPTVQDYESDREEFRAYTMDSISVFVRSYSQLLAGDLAALAAISIDLAGGTVDSPSGPQDGHAVYGHLEPIKAIIWVRQGDEFRGIYLPEIYRLGTRFKVNSWVTEAATRDLERGDLETERAVLKCKTLASCDFPDAIQFERTYIK